MTKEKRWIGAEKRKGEKKKLRNRQSGMYWSKQKKREMTGRKDKMKKKKEMHCFEWETHTKKSSIGDKKIIKKRKKKYQ